MFFDDQHGHCIKASDFVPTGRVPIRQTQQKQQEQQ
jgi:hypothetical protein